MSWITTLIRKKIESALVEEENTDYEIELFSRDKKYRAVFEGKLKIRKTT